jgi:glycosyltransferase involved in cell wall biosynthesis
MPASVAPTSTGRRRRVLVVHYFFPPLGGAGVPRVLKFVKYLPALGWDVTVITSGRQARWYGVRDESLLADIPPGVRVLRAPEIPVAQLRRRLLTPLTRLGAPMLTQYVGWPDVTAGWLPTAAAAAFRLTRSWRPDVVFSSSFPYTSHLVALTTSRAAGVPWVADFRDPWTLNPQPDPTPRLLGRINSSAERRLVHRADRIIVVDDRLDLVGLDRLDSRRVTIPNGIDEADIPNATDPRASPPDDRFRLTYVGSLYGDRDAAPVLEAIAELASAGRIDPDRFEVSIVGNVWLNGRVGADSPVPIALTGYVDRGRALREMQQASALLFYAPASTWAPSSKIFEYLACGRPILAVARPDNLAYRLVDELQAGAVADPREPAAIARAVAELYDRWLAGSLVVGPSVREHTLARFSRRHLTEKLAETLDAAIAEPRRR